MRWWSTEQGTKNVGARRQKRARAARKEAKRAARRIRHRGLTDLGMSRRDDWNGPHGGKFGLRKREAEWADCQRSLADFFRRHSEIVLPEKAIEA